MQTKTLAILLTLSLLAVPTFALADCLITADISAEAADSEFGAFTYTMDFTWDMDSPYGLSHFNLMVDSVGGTCSCSDIFSSMAFAAIAGTSGDENDCLVGYSSELECDGDPSIPNVEGIIFKFEPMEGDCEPGNMGSGTITFYSDLAPVSVDDQIIAMSDKGAHVYCSGTISGVFPGMACDPVSSETLNWDGIKSIYR